MKDRGANPNLWIQSSYWLLWFNAISAALGAIYLFDRPESMPAGLLDDSPFSSYFWPAMTLLVIVGGSSLIAAIARNRQLNGQWLLTIAAGAILLGWLIPEFIWIPSGWAVQLLYALVAIPMIVGGYMGWRVST